MGPRNSRPRSYYPRTYLPTETLIPCHGGTACYCAHYHAQTRYVYVEPGGRRYHDPMAVVERMMAERHFPGGVGGMGMMGGGEGGMMFGGLPWKHPREWTTADLEVFETVMEEVLTRRRGRRHGRGGGGENDYDSGGHGGHRKGGNGGARDMMNLLQQAEQMRRLQGVEAAMFGTEAERRNAAFRERLHRLLGEGGGGGGVGNGNGNRSGNGRSWGNGGGWAGDGGMGRRAPQRWEEERMERPQRNWDREMDEFRRRWERLGPEDGGDDGWRGRHF